jgi:DNA-directed RNA polymerase III subunit RPC6
MHDALFRQAIKYLESKHMITDMKSVEHPTRKMYIKSSLQPSDRATGGPWYTDGELDLAFISHMMKVCEDYIRKKTFYYGASHTVKKKEPKKGRTKPNAEEIKALREKGLGPRAKQEGTSERAKRKAEYDRMLPMPAGYMGYPTCHEITAHIDSLGISSTILTAMDVQQLLDIMCFDEKIERVHSGGGDIAYRTLRKSLRDEDTGPQNLLTEAPCGRCPVFDLCEEGGPVGPSNCEYFNDWLSL